LSLSCGKGPFLLKGTSLGVIQPELLTSEVPQLTCLLEAQLRRLRLLCRLEPAFPFLCAEALTSEPSLLPREPLE
jgi:hypothetical protein